MFNDEEIYQASVEWSLTIDDIRYILRLYEYNYLYESNYINEDYPNVNLVLKKWVVSQHKQVKDQVRSIKGELKKTKKESEDLANRLSEEMKTNKAYGELVDSLFDVINELKSKLEQNGVDIDEDEILKDFPGDFLDRYRCS